MTDKQIFTLCCPISTWLYAYIKRKRLYLELDIPFNGSLDAKRPYIRTKPVFKFVNFYIVCIQIKLYRKQKPFFTELTNWSPQKWS